MSLDIVQFGNIDVKVIVNVKNPDGSARNLTGATNLKIKLRANKSNTGKIFTANFEGAPINGALSYVTVADDIDVRGIWQAQAYYELGTFKGHTEPVEVFYVEKNLA